MCSAVFPQPHRSLPQSWRLSSARTRALTPKPPTVLINLDAPVLDEGDTASRVRVAGSRFFMELRSEPFSRILINIATLCTTPSGTPPLPPTVRQVTGSTGELASTCSDK
ncbi:hypothetical protein GCM10010442_20150 [Kitasatospora kifunensis]